jgi:hypothetical protein
MALCDNPPMVQNHKALVWLVLAALAALIAYVAFRGYLTPEMLLGFANSFTC